jgi:hypothetical protein
MEPVLPDHITAIHTVLPLVELPVRGAINVFTSITMEYASLEIHTAKPLLIGKDHVHSVIHYILSQMEYAIPVLIPLPNFPTARN